MIPDQMFLSLLLLGPAAQTCHAVEWVYDDHLTLALEATLTQGETGAANHVQAWAYLSPATVERWYQEGVQALRASPDVALSPRGYRVRIVITRDGAPVTPWRVTPGTGPLADWLGAYPASVGDHIVWLKQDIMRAAILVPLEAPPAVYRIAWIVNSRLARTETLQLPATPPPTPANAPEGLKSSQGVGIYPEGTQVGAPYPFTYTVEGEQSLVRGAGVIIALLSPLEAQHTLGLAQAPAMPVLVGWQPDLDRSVSCFFAQADASLAAPFTQTPVTRLRSGDVVEAHDGPRTVRIADPVSGKPHATLSLAPGGRVACAAANVAAVEQGLVRISVTEGALTLKTPVGQLVADGLALLDLTLTQPRLWCVSGSVQLGETRLRHGEVALWDGPQPSVHPYQLSAIAEVFLRTTFSRPAPPQISPPAPQRGVLVAQATDVLDAVLCRGLDPQQQPVGAGTQFPADLGELLLLAEHRFPPGQRAHLDVTLKQENETRSTHSVDVSGRGKFVITFRPQGNRPFGTGQWHLLIMLNGDLIRDIAFTIGE